MQSSKWALHIVLTFVPDFNSFLSLLQPWTSRGSPRVLQWSREGSCLPAPTAESWEATTRWDCSRSRRKGWDWSNKSFFGRDHRSGIRVKAFQKYSKASWGSAVTSWRNNWPVSKRSQGQNFQNVSISVVARHCILNCSLVERGRQQNAYVVKCNVHLE